MIDILTVFLLGLGVIIHPCTIAPNIAALTFLSQSKKRSELAMVLYVVGHTLAYILLGSVIVVLAKYTNILSSFSDSDSWGHYILMGVFLIAGIWFIWSSYRERHHHKTTHNIIATPLGAFISGMCVAFLFCPEAAFVFFGMVIPTAITSPAGLAVTVSFAIGTTIPLLCLSWVLFSGNQQFLSRFNVSRPVINRILGIIFILSAIVMLVF